MKHLKTFENLFPEINPVEYVSPKREHPSYKNEVKKKKRKKLLLKLKNLKKNYFWH